MKKLDRYILFKFLSTFFFCLILLNVVIIVVDLSEHTDDFVKSKLSIGKIITEYYYGFIPRIGAMLFPLFVFISVIFFTSKMAGRSEVIAILSSGVSYRRFMLPFMVGGFILAGLLWVGYQYVVPKANKIWGDFDKKYVEVNKGRYNANNSYKQNMYFKLNNDSYVGIKGYDTVSKTGVGFFVQTFKNNRITYNLRATNFSWDTAQKKWSLQGGSERTFLEKSELVTNFEKKSMSYNFKPIDLGKDEYLKDQMSTPELNQFIKLEKMRGSESLSSLLVERYNRDAVPFSVLILTLIGVSLASRKVRGGSGVHLAIGVLLCVVYILFSRVSLVFATKGNFSPWLAAWIPNFLFGFIAFYLYKRAPK
ncbi:MAG: YjgP/YjgQ family permease [Chitinophagaceae bacterium]|nr:MAG: YjgP/YjgQ family permease [Chitinophagaceae bacterium]